MLTRYLFSFPRSHLELACVERRLLLALNFYVAFVDRNCPSVDNSEKKSHVEDAQKS